MSGKLENLGILNNLLIITGSFLKVMEMSVPIPSVFTAYKEIPFQTEIIKNSKQEPT